MDGHRTIHVYGHHQRAPEPLEPVSFRYRDRCYALYRRLGRPDCWQLATGTVAKHHRYPPSRMVTRSTNAVLQHPMARGRAFLYRRVSFVARTTPDTARVLYDYGTATTH